MTMLYKLIDDRSTRDELRRVLRAPRGILAVNGGVVSGKTTTLLALVDDLIKGGTPCTVITSDPQALKPNFAADWNYQLIPNTEDAWRQALRGASAAGVVLAYMLEQPNARPLLEAARDGARVLTQVDTPFVGIDVAYSLQNIGITNAQMLEAFSCIVSQVLVHGLCADCRALRCVDAEDADLIYPGASQAMGIWHEVGRENCEPGGTPDRRA